jgi:hypothetical protein
MLAMHQLGLQQFHRACSKRWKKNHNGNISRRPHKGLGYACNNRKRPSLSSQTLSSMWTLLKPLLSSIIKVKEHLNLTSMEHNKEPMAFFTCS